MRQPPCLRGGQPLSLARIVHVSQATVMRNMRKPLLRQKGSRSEAVLNGHVLKNAAYNSSCIRSGTAWMPRVGEGP